MHYPLKSIEYFLPSSVGLNWPQFSTEALDICQHHIVQLGACQAKELNQLGGHLKPMHVSSIDKAWSCWPPSSWPVPRAEPSRRCNCHLSISFVIPDIPPHTNVAGRNTKHHQGQMFPNVVQHISPAWGGPPKIPQILGHSFINLNWALVLGVPHGTCVDSHMMSYSTYTAEFLCKSWIPAPAHKILYKHQVPPWQWICFDWSSDTSAWIFQQVITTAM